MSHIIAIDPGNTASAYAALNNNTYDLVQFAKQENQSFRKNIPDIIKRCSPSDVIIEMISSYGMAVGREVFETCVWIGRYLEIFESMSIPTHLIYRTDVKMNLCGQARAKDTNIRIALIDRFAKFDFKNGKGKKDNPDFFYGVSKDIWSAIAVGVTFLDLKKEAKSD